MEIILSRGITLNYDAKNWRNVTKTFNSNVVPKSGDKVESSAFKRDEEVKVADVVFNYEENYVYINLEVLNIESKDIDELKKSVDIYLMHNWECGYYGFDE